MENKNLIYIVAVGMDLHDGIIKSWNFYCNKYNCDFRVITENSNENRTPHWERYNVFNKYPGYDNYLYVDADAIVHWNAPDFFNILPDSDKLYVVKDIGSLEWVYNGILGYRQFFNEKINWWNYFNSHFIRFSSKHEQLFNDFLQFHDDNSELINTLQKATLKKGFDQTPFNYFVNERGVSYELLSEQFSLGHLPRKDILYNGMFMQIPTYIWQFNGIPKQHLYSIMDQTWNKIKTKYE